MYYILGEKMMFLHYQFINTYALFSKDKFSFGCANYALFNHDKTMVLVHI